MVLEGRELGQLVGSRRAGRPAGVERRFRLFGRRHAIKWADCAVAIGLRLNRV